MHRILVVDDEPSICEALNLGLASEEFAVAVAVNGGAGVVRGCEEKFDVLIVDLFLPDMDGTEVIRRIRARHPEIVPILITAHYTKESLAEAEECGISHYLEKPFEMKDMKAAIRRGLQHRNHRSA